MKIGDTSFFSGGSPLGAAKRLSGFKVEVGKSTGSDSITRTNKNNRVSSGAYLQASQATSASRIAAAATKDILEARQYQQDLVEEATISNNPTRREELQTVIDDLDTEIARIKSEAVDESGDNVLEGKTFYVSDDEIVALADLSSLADSSGIDVTTVSGAEDAEDTIDEIINITISGIEASSGSTQKAEQLLSDKVAIEADARKERGAVTQEEEATKLSEKVAKEVQDTVNAVTSDLDPQTVLQLIAD